MKVWISWIMTVWASMIGINHLNGGEIPIRLVEVTEESGIVVFDIPMVANQASAIFPKVSPQGWPPSITMEMVSSICCSSMGGIRRHLFLRTDHHCWGEAHSTVMRVDGVSPT